jgi:N-acetylated-alpha-linked acidic dipeptidase
MHRRASTLEEAHSLAAACDQHAFGLGHLEQALTRAEGLPGRPWFRHYVYAPGYYTGYGVKTLPGVREALELRDWKGAEEQAVITARTLEGFAAQIDKATSLLEKP